jgi:hypothetical protein
MKKVIIAFTAGQVLQLVILFAGQSLTYATNLLLFCVILGAAATLMLLLGSVLTALETIPPEEEMDEVAPIPKEIKVTNTTVARAEDVRRAAFLTHAKPEAGHE